MIQPLMKGVLIMAPLDNTAKVLPTRAIDPVCGMEVVPGQTSLILPIERQVRAWHKANRRLGWGIKEEEFAALQPPPEIEELEREQGYIGAILFYGFGNDGRGNSDPVLSGKIAWDYAKKRWWRKTWQCEYIDFDRSGDIRLRPGAPVRPKGFYYGKMRLKGKPNHLSVESQ